MDTSCTSAALLHLLWEVHLYGHSILFLLWGSHWGARLPAMKQALCCSLLGPRTQIWRVGMVAGTGLLKDRQGAYGAGSDLPVTSGALITPRASGSLSGERVSPALCRGCWTRFILSVSCRYLRGAGFCWNFCLMV